MSAEDPDSVHRIMEENVDLDLHKQYLIEVFWDFLVDNMRVSHLLFDLPLQKVQKDLMRLHALENTNPRKAVKVLLEDIRDSPEPEKWRMLFGIFRDSGNTLILNTLLEEKPDDQWYSNPEHATLVTEVFGRTIRKHLDLERVLPKVVNEELITKDDERYLMEIWRSGKRKEAVGVFLLLVHRLKEDWYKKLMTILYDCKYKKLVETISQETFEKIEKAKRESAGTPEGQSGSNTATASNSPPPTPNSPDQAAASSKQSGAQASSSQMDEEQASSNLHDQPSGRQASSNQTVQEEEEASRPGVGSDSVVSDGDSHSSDASVRPLISSDQTRQKSPAASGGVRSTKLERPCENLNESSSQGDVTQSVCAACSGQVLEELRAQRRELAELKKLVLMLCVQKNAGADQSLDTPQPN